MKKNLPENFSVTITNPNGGENIPIKSKSIEIQFDYKGTFNEEVGGDYGHRIELWQNGKLLGNIHNLDQFQINIYKTHVVHGYKPDYFYTKENGITKVKTLAAGSGYQLKVVLIQSFTPPGEVTQYRIS